MSYTRFHLENPRGEDLSYIRCSVKSNTNKPFRFYLSGEKVSKKDWNNKTQRLRKSAKNHSSINSYLDSIQRRINNQRRRLVMDGNLSSYEIEKFVNNMLGIQKVDFYGMWDQIIAEKERMTTSQDRNSNGRKYRNIKNKLYSFNPKLTFSDITEDMLHRWVGHLYDEYGMSTNTVARSIKFVNTFMKETMKRGYHNNDVCQHFSIKSVEITLPYLDKEEIERIYKTKGKLPHLENARLLLLKGCYTGQRFSDWDKIQPDRVMSINNADYINLSQNKTKHPVLLPLHPKLYKVIHTPHDQISLQKFNDYIKVYCKDIGLDQAFIKNTYKQNKPQQKVYKKYELVSSHIGRRSFACNSILEGINDTLIMKVGGWKSYSSFKRYVQLCSTDGLDQFAGAFEV